MAKPWQFEIKDIIETFKTNSSEGISSDEARKRLGEYGFNQLVEKKEVSPFSIFISQFKSIIIWVLISAAIISGFLKEWLDAGAILVIVIMNALLGFIQEYRAEKAISALKKLSAPMAKVIRDGVLKVIPANEVVPGDLVQVEAGDHIPADARLISVAYFQTQEASLTGESTPVVKSSEKISEDNVPIGERKNMIYMGTSVVSGKATAIVIETGMRTELGKIAEMIEETEKEETPLQKRLAVFGKWLVYFCLVIVVIVLFLGIFRGIPFIEMFLTSVSLAVAAIPEGLPAVVTIALALGVQRMVKRNALIRKLPSVETLGSTNVICSDKTGTLTKNEMTVKKVWAGGKLFDVEGIGYNPEGKFKLDGKTIDPALFVDLIKCLTIGVLCNNAELMSSSQQEDYKSKLSPVQKSQISNPQSSNWSIIGDPTEGAILTVAGKAGLWKKDLISKFPLLVEIPFDSQRKTMTIIRKDLFKKEVFAFVKGAPDIILSKSNWIYFEGNVEALDDKKRQDLLNVNEKLGSEALRVLAMAYKKMNGYQDDHSPEKVEQNLIFVGLLGMIDPPRPEVKSAISICKEAGIKPVMITGDHKNTALAIAKELELVDEDSIDLTGIDLDRLSEEELVQQVDKISVYSRVSAEHKLKIVNAFKRRGAIVAMTGDGVNDAPALKTADIGVAMGITGTDVTKEAADMIITDDNFASIVSAVEEGRIIFQNIKKFIYFLLSCNTGEIFVLFFSSLFGWPLPLLPIQILWTNLITDGLPALALGVDKPEPDLMKRPPDLMEKRLIHKQFLIRVLSMGAVIAFTSLFAFFYVYFVEKEGIVRARTAAFVVLVCSQLFHSFNCRSDRVSIFKLGLFTNKSLLVAVFTSFVLQLCIVYFKGAQYIFKTSNLTFFDWGLVIILSTAPLWIMELVKLIKRKT